MNASMIQKLDRFDARIDIKKMAVGESAWFLKFYEPIYLEIIWVCINDTSVFSKNHKNLVHSFKNIMEINFCTV